MVPECWPWLLALAATALGFFTWGVLAGRKDGYGAGREDGYGAGYDAAVLTWKVEAIRQGFGWWEVEIGGRTHFHWKKLPPETDAERAERLERMRQDILRHHPEPRAPEPKFGSLPC